MFCSKAAFRAASGELISGIAVVGSLLTTEGPAGAVVGAVAEPALTAVLVSVGGCDAGEEQAQSKALLKIKGRAEARRCRIGKMAVGMGQNEGMGAREEGVGLAAYLRT